MKTFMNAMAGVVAGTLMFSVAVGVIALAMEARNTAKEIYVRLNNIEHYAKRTRDFVENLERVEEETKG